MPLRYVLPKVMSAHRDHHSIVDQIQRTRAAIAGSRASILRSRELIGDTTRSVAHFAGRFALADVQLTDEQRAAALDLGEAAAEQRAIEREVQITIREVDGTLQPVGKG